MNNFDQYDMKPSTSAKNEAVGSDSTQVVIIEDDHIDLEAHMLTSCLVTWFCNICFGTAAFFVARSARNKSLKKVQRLVRITRCLNISGVLLTWIILFIFLVLYFTHNLGNHLPYYGV